MNRAHLHCVCFLCLLTFGVFHQAVAAAENGGFDPISVTAKSVSADSLTGPGGGTPSLADNNVFLQQIFEKYGQDGRITFEGFQKLLDRLGLGMVRTVQHEALIIHSDHANSSDHSSDTELLVDAVGDNDHVHYPHHNSDVPVPVPVHINPSTMRIPKEDPPHDEVLLYETPQQVPQSPYTSVAPTPQKVSPSPSPGRRNTRKHRRKGRRQQRRRGQKSRTVPTLAPPGLVELSTESLTRNIRLRRDEQEGPADGNGHDHREEEDHHEGHDHDDHKETEHREDDDHGQGEHDHDHQDHDEHGESQDHKDHGHEGHEHGDDHGDEGHEHEDDHGHEGHEHEDDHGHEGHEHEDDHGHEGHEHEDDHGHEGHEHEEDHGHEGHEHEEDHGHEGHEHEDDHGHEGHEPEGHEHREDRGHEGHEHEDHDDEDHEHEGHDHEDHDHEGHEHDHHDHKSHVQCLSATEIMAAYNIPKDLSAMTKPDFVNICPLLITQIDAQACIIHETDDHDHDHDHDHGQEHEEHKAKGQLPAAVWGYGILAVTVISILAVLGIVLLPFMQQKVYQFLLCFLVALAVGTLTGDAVLHLLPHALGLHAHSDEEGEEGHGDHEGHSEGHEGHDEGSHLDPVLKGLAVLFGIYFLFIMEKLMGVMTKRRAKRKAKKLRKKMEQAHPAESYELRVSSDSPSEEDHCHHHHHHHHHDNEKLKDAGIATMAWMVIMGDGLHNFSDGMAIGAAFASGIPGGISTSIAVFCHELPHELGDFALLIKAGMSVKQAILYNLMSACICYIGLLIGLGIGNLSSSVIEYVFAVTAGMFLYVGLVDMLPDMVHPGQPQVIGHDHGEHDHGHNHDDDFCHEEGRKKKKKNHKKNEPSSPVLVQSFGLLVGIGIMLLIAVYEDQIRV